MRSGRQPSGAGLAIAGACALAGEPRRAGDDRAAPFSACEARLLRKAVRPVPGLPACGDD